MLATRYKLTQVCNPNTNISCLKDFCSFPISFAAVSLAESWFRGRYSSSVADRKDHNFAEMGDGRENRNNGEKSKANNKQLPSDPNQYTILKEGDADILMHGNDVFYNKTQVVNRDLSIAVLRTFVAKRKEEHTAMWAKKLNRKTGTSSSQPDSELAACDSHPVLEPSELAAGGEENGAAEALNTGRSGNDDAETMVLEGGAQAEVADGGEAYEKVAKPVIRKVCEEQKPLRVLEALAASGLRALRYVREVEGVGSVVAVDNDKVAVEACKRNIKLNGSVAASKVEPQLADARVYMLTHEKEFDVVDLDPYGSPSVFLDSAVQSVADGGILMCTATDMAVLCGNNGEVCYSKYGAYPTRAKYCHEMALRILLACIEVCSPKLPPFCFACILIFFSAFLIFFCECAEPCQSI
eukprot:Gb_38019 [translate_table: standard]